MTKSLLILSVCCALLVSCSNADPKKMATDICHCMEPAIGKLSPEGKRMISKAFNEGGEVQTELQEQLMAVEDEAERIQLANEFSKAGDLMQGSKMRICLEAIDKKYSIRKWQEKEMQQKLTKEMENQCPVGADFFKYSLKVGDEGTSTGQN